MPEKSSTKKCAYGMHEINPKGDVGGGGGRSPWPLVLFSLGPAGGHTLNLGGLSKVSKVSSTSQLLYEIPSFEIRFR